MNQPISEAFALIAEYACRQGWTPIGFRSWTVGQWKITVNGTREEKDNIPPYHAFVEHHDYLGVMLISPVGGDVVGGWRNTEAEFIEAMRAQMPEGQ